MGVACFRGVDVQNGRTTRLVGQSNLNVDLQTPRTQQRFVNHVLSIRHADQQDVVQRVDTVDLGQQLVDDGVTDASAVARGASLLANRVDLVENDDVQLTVVTVGFLDITTNTG